MAHQRTSFDAHAAKLIEALNTSMPFRWSDVCKDEDGKTYLSLFTGGRAGAYVIEVHHLDEDEAGEVIDDMFRSAEIDAGWPSP